jgi:restriction endonuclease Mrr
MGAEYQYTVDIEIPCWQCQIDITIELEIIEYPVGAINQINTRARGADIINYLEIEYLDESPIWLPPAKNIIVPNQRIITDQSEISNTIPKLINLIKEDSSYIYKISTREFEHVIAEIFKQQGFDVKLTKRTRDGGKDVIAINKNALGLETSYFIECKRHSLESKVDVGIVRHVYGVHSSRNGPNKSIIATTSTFTPDAIKYATTELRSRWDMDLKDIDDVLSWIRNYK